MTMLKSITVSLLALSAPTPGFADYDAGQLHPVEHTATLTVGGMISHQEQCFLTLADDLGLQTQGRTLAGDGKRIFTNEAEMATRLYVFYNNDRAYELSHDMLWGMPPDYAATHELREYLERVSYGQYRLKGLHLSFNLDPDVFESPRVKLVLREGLPRYQFTAGPSRFGELEGPNRVVLTLEIAIPAGYQARASMINALSGLPAEVTIDAEGYADCLANIGAGG